MQLDLFKMASCATTENIYWSDSDFKKVYDHLNSIPNFEAKAGKAVRDAVFEALRWVRTGRLEIEDLYKTEKTYIGTLVEIELRDQFGFQKGNKLDYKIVGIEVDCKFTIQKNWAIPQEARGKLCLIGSLAKKKRNIQFSLGLIRADESILNTGRNRDRKTTIKKTNKKWLNYSKWLVCERPLPKQAASLLNEAERERVRDLLLDLKKETQKIIESPDRRPVLIDLVSELGYLREQARIRGTTTIEELCAALKAK